MASPADVKITNDTHESIKTKVTHESWVEDNAKPVDGKTINRDTQGVYRVAAKTGHHGEITLDLLTASGSVIGLVQMKSLKDPQEGEKSLAVAVHLPNYDISAMGYRSTPGHDDLRRIEILVSQRG